MQDGWTVLASELGINEDDFLRPVREYWASLGFCAHADFAEGIRAVLVDKDRNPQWQPATLEAITPEFIEDHLRARTGGPHPLAALV